MEQLNENYLRKAHAAVEIGNALGYIPESDETPEQTIANAILNSGPLSDAQIDILDHMLKLAEECGVDFTDILVENDKADEDCEEEMSDSEIDGMISHVDDWDDIIDSYDPEELAIVDDETGEELHDESIDESVLNEVLSRAERLKSRMRFMRTAGKRERAVKLALRRKSSNVTINKRARHMAVSLMKKKLARGKDISTMGFADKARIERMIERRSKLIGRMALKLTGRIRTIEKTRLHHPIATKA